MDPVRAAHMKPKPFLALPHNRPRGTVPLSVAPEPMKRALLVCLVLAHTAMLHSADLSGSDDFNDNVKDSSKWGPAIAIGICNFTERNHELELTTSAAGNQVLVLQPWILNTASLSSDWEIVARAGNLSEPDLFSSQSCSLGVAVLSSITVSEYVYIGLYASTLGGPPLRRGFVSGLTHSTLDIAQADSFDIGVSAGAVRLLFDSRTRVITSYYDSGIMSEGYSWVKLGSFGVQGNNGETGNTNWDLSGPQPFIVGVYGAAINLNVAADLAVVDDFSVLTASPDPPILHTSQEGEQLILSWPRSALGFELQESASLDPGVWMPSGPPVVINDSNVFKTEVRPGSRFYRLRRP
jgi:hypothetical protein